MVNVKITTNTTRKNAIVDVDTSLNDIFDEQDITVGNAVVYVDGMMATASERQGALSDMGIEDETTINVSIIVKADSAR